MKDFRAVQITGAIHPPQKVRAIFKDGLVKVFNQNCELIEVAISQEPRRVPRTLGRWTAQTSRGPIELVEKCLTCGGHFPIARKSLKDLWNVQQP